MADGNFDYMAAVNEAVATGSAVDMTADRPEGEGFKPIPEGMVGLRLVEYVELGKHEKVYQGVTSIVDKVHLGFEVSGPKIEKVDGKNPRITVQETLSNSQKARLRKIFNLCNHDGEATIMPQLLDKPLRGRIYHNTVGEGKDAKTYANLYNKDGVWSITGPWREVEDEEGNVEKVLVTVEERTCPIRLFLWANASKAMWDTLFIDGMTEERKNDKGEVVAEARSKNYFQNLIKKAKNWEGSPIQQVLLGDGLDVGDAEKVERKEEDKQASDEARVNKGAKDPLDD